MAFLIDAYAEDEAPNAKGGVDKRTVLRLDPRLAPVKAAVLPLSRNADLSPKARDLAAELRQNWNVDFDDAGAIGRRYRRQDEIGTPYCVTVDFDTLDDDAVTIRERDSMKQERVALDQVQRLLRRASRRLLTGAIRRAVISCASPSCATLTAAATLLAATACRGRSGGVGRRPEPQRPTTRPATTNADGADGDRTELKIGRLDGGSVPTPTRSTRRRSS